MQTEEKLTIDPNKPTFRKELTSLINKYCKENESDTPDFLLAEYIDDMVEVYTSVIRKRDKWFGFEPFHELKGDNIEIK